MKVAVTGVGGGVGQSIMKALTISSLPVEVYPVDVQPLSAGLFRGMGGNVLPRPEIAGSMQAWENWLTVRGIDVLIPGSDHDLVSFAAVWEDWKARGVCQVLVSDLDLVQACRDKAVTCERLRENGIAVPRSAWDVSTEEAARWARTVGYPVIIKPRSGSASRSLHLVQDEEELRFFLSRTANPILQEYLSLSGKIEEFTCAVFVNKHGSPVSTFMARRDLSDGTTYRAEIGFWPEIHSLVLAIGSKFRPRGPLNVQLRLTDRGPVPFELNVRCSGTAAIRAHFGYNEPEMMLRHYVLGEELTPPKIRTGYALRYWNEVFLEGVDRQRLQKGPDGLQGFIRSWP